MERPFRIDCFSWVETASKPTYAKKMAAAPDIIPFESVSLMRFSSTIIVCTSGINGTSCSFMKKHQQ
jgi:hypothetical protein